MSKLLKAFGLILMLAGSHAKADPDIRGSIDGPRDPAKPNPQQPFAWPVCSELLETFGYAVDPISKHVRFHSGIDMKGAFGTEVRASRKGVVVAAERRGPLGLMIEIDHGDGLVTRYAHLQALMVKSGETVSKGWPIARVGSSGRSTGPHLHFEIRRGNTAEDPLRHLAAEANCQRRSTDQAYIDTHSDGRDATRPQP